MHPSNPPPIRVGIWGTFDVENLGDALFPRISEQELRDRVPDAQIRRFSPYGYLNPGCFDDPVPVEPLGRWSERRVGELAEDLDAVLIGGGDIIHTSFDKIAHCYGRSAAELTDLRLDRFFIEALEKREERIPAMWGAVGIPFDLSAEEAARVRAALRDRAYVTVRDEISLERLRSAGVEGEVAVVPDIAVLTPRLFEPDALRERVQRLRERGWYPAGEVLLVQGNRAATAFLSGLIPALEEILRRNPGLRIATVGVGPCHGDEEFAAALAVQAPFEVAALPPRLSLEDTVAAIAGALGFVGSSFHGSLVALSFGRPAVALDANHFSKMRVLDRMFEDPLVCVRDPGQIPDAFAASEEAAPRPDALERLQAEADVHFGRIAEVIKRSDGPARPPDPAAALGRRLRLLEAAYEVRVRRLTQERVDAGRGAHLQGIRIRQIEAMLERTAHELALVRGSRTFRYTAWLRSLRRILSRDRR